MVGNIHHLNKWCAMISNRLSFLLILITATECAWKFTFKGDGANVLLTTISNYLDKQRNPYARHSSIINSSGTGKSRMVDELATKIITVPMCLREDGSQGFTVLSFLSFLLVCL
jgi:hypothetical protein